MAGKLPLDAYEYYYTLGPKRSYQAVADYYQVSKRAVAKRASQEAWQQKVEERDERVRDHVEKAADESFEAMMDRHLRQVKAIQGRALEALRKMPLNTAMEACRALGQGMAEERKIRGDSSDRHDVSRTDAEIDALIEARRDVDQRIREMDRCEDLLAHRRRLQSGNGYREEGGGGREPGAV